MPTPPDCEAMAIPPGRNRWLVNVALSPHAVATIPSESGPTRRMPCRRAAASTSPCRAAPAGPVSANPAVTTTARPHTGGATALDDRSHRRRRHGDDGEVGCRRSDGRSPICAAARSTTVTAPSNERGGGSGSARPATRASAGADDDHVTGTQDRLQRAHGAAPSHASRRGPAGGRRPSGRAGPAPRRPRTSCGGPARRLGTPAASRRCRGASAPPVGGTRLRGRCRRGPRRSTVAMPS